MEKSRATVADQAPNATGDGTRAKLPVSPIANALDELRALKEDYAHLQRVLEAHDTLARLALADAGFSRLAAALCDLVGNPVSIESRFFKTLAYSRPADAPPREDRPVSLRTLRKERAAQPFWSRLQREREAVLVPASGERVGFPARVVSPVVISDDVVGYLSIVERDRPFESRDLELVREAALAVGIAFVRQRADIDAELRFKGDALDAVLRAADAPPEVQATRAALLGYDRNAPQTMLVLAPVCADADRPTSLHGLAAVVPAWARRVASGSLIAEREGEVVVLLSGDLAKPRSRSRMPRADRMAAPTSSSDPDADLDPALAELTSSLRREVAGYFPDLVLSIAIAPPARDSRGLAEVYAAARRTLAMLDLLGQRGRSISTNDPRLAVFLLFDGTRPDTRREFVDLVLGPLIAYDRRGHRRLVETLETYLDRGGNLETTARTLDVHTSTLKYRLQRIAEVSGIDARNTDHRFNAALALRLRALDDGRLAEAGAAPPVAAADPRFPQ
ncbi:MAG: PucR family transcriptional regulator [Chloroflexota bacterium]